MEFGEIFFEEKNFWGEGSEKISFGKCGMRFLGRVDAIED